MGLHFWNSYVHDWNGHRSWFLLQKIDPSNHQISPPIMVSRKAQCGNNAWVEPSIDGTGRSACWRSSRLSTPGQYLNGLKKKNPLPKIPARSDWWWIVALLSFSCFFLFLFYRPHFLIFYRREKKQEDWVRRRCESATPTALNSSPWVPVLMKKNHGPDFLPSFIPTQKSCKLGSKPRSTRYRHKENNEPF